MSGMGLTPLEKALEKTATLRLCGSRSLRCGIGRAWAAGFWSCSAAAADHVLVHADFLVRLDGFFGCTGVASVCLIAIGHQHGGGVGEGDTVNELKVPLDFFLGSNGDFVALFERKRLLKDATGDWGGA